MLSVSFERQAVSVQNEVRKRRPSRLSSCKVSSLVSAGTSLGEPWPVGHAAQVISRVRIGAGERKPDEVLMLHVVWTAVFLHVAVGDVSVRLRDGDFRM